MPRKPTLSPSKITTYLACPLKYRWTFVHPHRWLVRARHYYSFGSSLHAVLEKVYERGDAGIDAIELDAVYDESWIDAGYSSSESMQEAYGEGKELIEAFLDQERQVPKFGKTIAVEKLLKKPYDQFTLVGRIDRLSRADDGAMEIIDYKTRRSAVSDEEVRRDIAMSIYQVLARHNYPEEMAVRARLVALQTNASGVSELDEQERHDFEFELQEIGNRIVNHEWYEMEPRFKPICRQCDFLSLCQKHPEFKEDFDRVEA